MEYLEKVANGAPMLIFCAIIVVVVIAQPVVYCLAARKRGKELGMKTEDLNRTMVNTAVFAIMPSVPILASYLIMLPTLGNYFPWMRLSVVGSYQYELTVGNAAAVAFGYEGLAGSDFPISVFLSILLILTVCILGGNIFNLFFLKSYDKAIINVMAKNKTLIPLITGAIFIGMFSVFSTPTIANVNNNPVAVIVMLCGGFSYLLLNKLFTNKPGLKQHVFSFSLIIGMVVAMIATPIVNSLAGK